jgi:hypothetical protein
MKPELIGHLKAGNAVYRYQESELSPYAIEREFLYLDTPDSEELEEILSLVKEMKK